MTQNLLGSAALFNYQSREGTGEIERVTMKIRVVILEDQDSQRRLLRRMLAEHPDVEITGESPTIKEAEEQITSQKPDLLLMDVHVADGKSFKLLERMHEPPPVIFISGHREYAVDAFGFRALDYLVKPFSGARLAEALERFRESRTSNISPLVDAGKLLLLRQGAKTFFVSVADLVSIQAEREYTTLWDLHGRTFVEKRPLRYWVERLPADQFVQLDRSTVINFSAIDHVVQRSPQEMALFVKAHAEPLILGRAASARLRACCPTL